MYDITLNFKKNIPIEFFEWNDEDNIDNLKKIPFIKVNHKVIKDILMYQVKFDTSLKEIINKKDKSLLLSDGVIIVGLLLNNNYEEIGISYLLPQDEEQIKMIVDHLNIETINYAILKLKKQDNLFLTRHEKEIKEKLLVEFNNCFKTKNLEKLKYYYYEYFNENISDLDKAYHKLIDSLKDIDDSHYKILEILNLSYQKK